MLRPYRDTDNDALYAICLATGDAGKDASHLYRDPKLMGHVYAGPYAAFAPELCFVLEDDEGVGGYVIGTRDTYGFAKRLESEWWPALRKRYADPVEIGSRDDRMVRLIHRPPRTPRRISESYPAHLHIDLLPRFQGKGWGRRMIDHWLGAVRVLGASGTHLTVGESNARAVHFYRAYGFREILRTGPPYDGIYFGINEPRAAVE
jgi:ribosomal protein S18 acetylase RimI-like enzyme